MISLLRVFEALRQCQQALCLARISCAGRAVPSEACSLEAAPGPQRNTMPGIGTMDKAALAIEITSRQVITIRRPPSTSFGFTA